MLSLILLMTVLSDTPEQMMETMNEFEKIDCEAMAESASKQCKTGCAGIKTKQDRKECLQTCDQSLGSLTKNCKEARKNIDTFKSKSKDEQRKILQEASEADKHHH